MPNIIIIDPTNGDIVNKIKSGCYSNIEYLINNNLLSVVTLEEAKRNYNIKVDPLEDNQIFFLRNPYTCEYLSMYSDDMLATLASDESLALNQILLAMGAKSAFLEVKVKKMWFGLTLTKEGANIGLSPYDEKIDREGLSVDIKKEEGKDKDQKQTNGKEVFKGYSVTNSDLNYNNNIVQKDNKKEKNNFNIILEKLRLGFGFRFRSFKIRLLLEQRKYINFEGNVNKPDSVDDLEKLLAKKGFNEDRILNNILNRIKKNGEYTGCVAYEITYFNEIKEALRILNKIDCKIFTDNLDILKRLKYVKPITAVVKIDFGGSRFI